MSTILYLMEKLRDDTNLNSSFHRRPKDHPPEKKYIFTLTLPEVYINRHTHPKIREMMNIYNKTLTNEIDNIKNKILTK